MDFDKAYKKDVDVIIKSMEGSCGTKVGNTVVRALYSNMKESFAAARSADCSILRRVTGREYRRVEPGRYFPHRLYDRAFGPDVKQFMCKSKISNRDVEIRFGISAESEPIMEKLAAYVHCILAVLYFCGKYSKRHCSRTLQVIIILLDDAKMLPETAVSTIGALHVNSGFSSVCQTDNEIVVYRAEEWFKVFIHESFHAFGLEGILYLTQASAGVRKLYSVDSAMSLGEAYVETWARVINASVASFVRSQDFNEFFDMLCFSLMVEARFSALQATKALNFMGIDYDTICEPGNHVARLMYKEETNVFSYYVLSCILMCNIGAFLKLCARNNTSWAIFGDSELDVDNFTRFIKEIYMNNETKKIFTSVQKRSSHPGMRMSIIDVW